MSIWSIIEASIPAILARRKVHNVLNVVGVASQEGGDCIVTILNRWGETLKVDITKEEILAEAALAGQSQSENQSEGSIL